MIKGCDVSHWNYTTYATEIKRKMEKKEIRFMFAKATEGITVKDNSFKKWMEMCSKYPETVMAGAYHYARAEKNKNAVMEAKHFLSVVKPYIKENGLLLALDVEGESLSAKNLNEWVIQWLDYVYKETGIKPLVYCSTSETARFSCANNPYKKDYGLWCANWKSPNPSKQAIIPWGFWAFHQYTNKPYDKDQFHSDDFNALRKYGLPEKESSAAEQGCGCCENCKCKK